MCDVCVYESLSVCVCPCLLLVKVFTVDMVNEVARRPPKPPTGGQAVTAQLIVVSIWAAGKGRSSVHGCRESHGKNRAGMNTENAEAATPEASRSSDLSEERHPSIYIFRAKTFTSLQDTAFLGCS